MHVWNVDICICVKQYISTFVRPASVVVLLWLVSCLLLLIIFVLAAVLAAVFPFVWNQ
jgi:hypothetical protein